jgi:hypothetical protein
VMYKTSIEETYLDKKDQSLDQGSRVYPGRHLVEGAPSTGFISRELHADSSKVMCERRSCVDRILCIRGIMEHYFFAVQSIVHIMVAFV